MKHLHFTPLPQALVSLLKGEQKDCRSHRWWMIIRKYRLADTAGQLHIYTYRSCVSMYRPVQEKNPSMETVFSAEEPLTMDSCWEKWSQVGFVCLFFVILRG